MPETIIERFLIRPVATLPDFFKVRMAFGQTRIEHGNFDSSTLKLKKKS